MNAISDSMGLSCYFLNLFISIFFGAEMLPEGGGLLISAACWFWRVIRMAFCNNNRSLSFVWDITSRNISAFDRAMWVIARPINCDDLLSKLIDLDSTAHKDGKIKDIYGPLLASSSVAKIDSKVWTIIISMSETLWVNIMRYDGTRYCMSWAPATINALDVFNIKIWWKRICLNGKYEGLFEYKASISVVGMDNRSYRQNILVSHQVSWETISKKGSRYIVTGY